MNSKMSTLLPIILLVCLIYAVFISDPEERGVTAAVEKVTQEVEDVVVTGCGLPDEMKKASNENKVCIDECDCLSGICKPSVIDSIPVCYDKHVIGDKGDVGYPLEGLETGKKCEYNIQCSSKWCNPVSNICEDKIHHGSICNSGHDAQCHSNDCICKDVTHSEQQGCYCAPPQGEVLKSGSRCHLDDQCESFWCKLEDNTCSIELNNGEICESGEESECRSSNCDCSFPNSEGDTCFCDPDDKPPLVLVGKWCHDDDWCESGWCNSETSKCDIKLESGELCATGDENQCKSNNCDCAFPHSSGDTCFCDPDDKPPLVANGLNCHDDDWCQSGWCNSETNKCQKKFASGKICNTGDERQCESNQCDCAFPHSSGETCFCDPEDGPKLKSWVPEVPELDLYCHDNDWCESGWCLSAFNRCAPKKKLGESCQEEGGDDFICEDKDENGNYFDTECGQSKNNTYICCKNTITPFGSLSDWCTGIDVGKGCYYDDQCKTGWCDRRVEKCSERLDSGNICDTGDENQCKSGECDCAFPHSSGNTCFCDPVDGVKVPNGLNCYDDDWCQSGWCNSETNKCSARLESGKKCLTGDENQCLSGECDCAFPQSSGETCYCDPDDGVKIDNFVENYNENDVGNCHDDDWCKSGWCNSLTDKCSPRLDAGHICYTGDENQCKSGECDCAFPHSSGDTCFCEPTNDYEVANGLNCHDDDWCTSTWCYNDKCKALKKLGESCNEENGADYICEGALECGQGRNNSYVCCENTITPFGSLSDWCTGIETGGGCYYDDQCKTGWCNSETNICSERLDSGEQCLTGDERQCKSGECDCAFPHSSGETCFCDPHKTKPLVSSYIENYNENYKREEGSNCYDDDWCQSGWCNSTTNKCSERFDSGHLCLTGDENQCKSGECDCAFPHSSGDTCFCDPAGKNPLVDNGLNCYDDDWCKSGWCNSETNKCSGRLEDGLICATGDEAECLSGDCDCAFPHSSGNTCYCEPRNKNTLENGLYCHDHDWCKSGWCYNNKCTAKRILGETCHHENGSDFICEGSLECGYENDNNYRCCAQTGLYGISVSDWCENLDNGKGCEYDGQCKSGWCYNDKCRPLKKLGESCNEENGSDFICENSECGYEADGNYVCCNDPGNFGVSLSDWCRNLDNGKGCEYDGQCKSGWCYNSKCKALKKLGESCNEENGSDFICENSECGHEADNGKYFCCNNTITPIGSTSDWCDNLDDGKGCEYDSQCKSGWCYNDKCKALKTLGQYCNEENGSDFICKNSKCAWITKHGAYKCCTNTTSQLDGKEYCDDTTGVNQICKYDSECSNNKCGYDRSKNKYVCCGERSTLGAVDYCHDTVDVGKVCRYDVECKGDAECAGNNYGLNEGRCSAKCNSNQYRSGYNCVPKKNVGQTCDDGDDNQCKNGKCGYDRSSDRYECCSSIGTYGGLEYCTRHLGPNAVCRYDAECKDNYCAGNAYGAKLGRCRQKCNGNQYQSGNYCHNKKHNNHGCSSGGQCRSGHCVSTSGGGKHCRASNNYSCGGTGCFGPRNRGGGSRCRYDDQCRSDWCGGNRYGIRDGTCD